MTRAGAAAHEREHWLLVRGTGDRPLGARVERERVQRHSSTRRPRIQRGDRALLYAAGWQAIFGVVEVVGEPENDPARVRWSWQVPLHPLTLVGDLGRAPPVEDAGVSPRSLGRHSYVRLTPAQFDAGRAAIVSAADRPGRTARPRAVVLVEGESDRVALETLAARRGLDLRARNVSVVAIGGAQAIARALERYGPRGLDTRLAGLCDAGEEPEFRRALEHAGLGAEPARWSLERLGFYVCVADLEDELIRALGAAEVERVIEAHGDLGAFRTLQKQPAWQGRAVAEQLRRFMGSGGRRKVRYARFLVEALDLCGVPRPLDEVLAYACGP